MNLHSRLRLRAKSRSGKVHRVYLCEGGTEHHADPELHAWCSVHMTGLNRTGHAVDCKSCLAGGSTWAVFVNAVEHSELSSAMGLPDVPE